MRKQQVSKIGFSACRTPTTTGGMLLPFYNPLNRSFLELKVSLVSRSNAETQESAQRLGAVVAGVPLIGHLLISQVRHSVTFSEPEVESLPSAEI
jgi:hypothetical protein